MIGSGVTNRLSSVLKNGSPLANFNYNALGERLRKETPAYGGNRLYQYGDNGQLLSEHFINGQGRHYKTRNYIWLGSQPIAMVEQLVNTSHAVYTEAIYYLHTDHLNTPQRITNAQQQVIWQWQGDAFGDGKEIADPDGDGKKFWFPLRFPGQYYDEETGLNYNYYRDYDRQLGRYVQSDPIGLQGGLNTYAYVMGNPLSFTDPLGNARQGGKTGRWWEFTNRNFQRWFHLCVKQPGDQDATREELIEAYAEWVQYGRPDGKNGCGGPPPSGEPNSSPEASGDNCDSCKKAASVIVVGGTAYFVYRCVRMAPSLFPPLWPTIPANVLTP